MSFLAYSRISFNWDYCATIMHFSMKEPCGCLDWIFTLPEQGRGVTEPNILLYMVLQSLRILILDNLKCRKALLVLNKWALCMYLYLLALLKNILFISYINITICFRWCQQVFAFFYVSQKFRHPFPL